MEANYCDIVIDDVLWGSYVGGEGVGDALTVPDLGG